MTQYIRRPVGFSIFSALYSLAFLAIINFFDTSYPWVLYCVPAMVIWPLAVALPRRFSSKPFAWALVILVTAYYLLLNIFLAPGHPWTIYIAFPLLWYPLSLHLAKKPYYFGIFGLIWALLFFGTVNFVTSPSVLWAVYPIFVFAWWPLSIRFFGRRR